MPFFSYKSSKIIKMFAVSLRSFLSSSLCPLLLIPNFLYASICNYANSLRLCLLYDTFQISLSFNCVLSFNFYHPFLFLFFILSFSYSFLFCWRIFLVKWLLMIIFDILFYIHSPYAYSLNFIVVNIFTDWIAFASLS